MTAATFVDIPCAPAICRCAGSADRGSAVRLLFGQLALPRISLPDTGPVSGAGRVHGLGRFIAEEVGATLATALPAPLRNSLRGEFEWYACRGAFFHNDAHFVDVLFGTWCVAGPAREVVFSRAGLRVPARPGDWVIFDPFEPHAVLDRGAMAYSRQHYAGASVSLFVGFELRLDAAAQRAFGIGPARPGSPVLASSVAINAETGALS